MYVCVCMCIMCLGMFGCVVCAAFTDADVWYVEKLLHRRKSKKNSGGYEYLVKWQGWADKYNNWVSECVCVAVAVAVAVALCVHFLLLHSCLDWDGTQ